MQGSLREKIIAYIQTNGKARPYDLFSDLPFGRAAIHRNLKKLVDEGILVKNGKAPTVFYTPGQLQPAISTVQIAPDIKDFIDRDYLYITPQGQIISGYDGFLVWLQNTGQTNKSVHLAETYVKNRNLYNQYRSPEGWIDTTKRLENTFPDNMNLDKILLADFYSLTQFGKTKLGTLMLYAKQSQNRDMANDVCFRIKPLVEKIIARFKIDAVAYIPPSIPRNVQFMTQLLKCLKLPLPKIDLVKSRTGQVIVAQKTLEKLNERVANARDTIFIKETALPYKNVLIIDDAVGSGASLNETAKKLKSMLASGSKIIGFAIVGSFKGFDVIREV